MDEILQAAYPDPGSTIKILADEARPFQQNDRAFLLETLSPAPPEDSTYISISMVYLVSLKNRVYRYSIEQLINEQQKTLDKTKAKILSLKNDSGDIAKK